MAIMQRYVRSYARWNVLDYMFQKALRPSIFHSIQRPSHIHVAPRIDLALLRLEVNAGSKSAASTNGITVSEESPNRSIAPIWKLASSRLIQRQESVFTHRIKDLQQIRRMKEEHLVQRLIRRYERRVETTRGESGVIPASLMPQNDLFMLPRVVRRPAESATENPAGTPEQTAARSVQVSSRPDNNVLPVERTSFDVERLTDQVVRSIDRRILAHRERLGRV